MIKCKRTGALPLMLLCGALSLVISLPGTAQEEQQRWYRVELLIFTHQSESAQTSETWEPTPELVYPQQSRFLVDPALAEQNLTLFDATGEMDDRGHQTLTVIPPPIEGETGEEEEAEPAVVEQTAPEREPALATGLDEIPEEILPATPSPFVLLANSELEFQGKAAYMQRTGRYRTLFHETWVQPMLEESDTLPIVIDRSGDSEDWPQLQGSVKLYISRYLHLQTNLWLNTAGHYLPADWNMPAAPLGPKSVTVIYPPEPEVIDEPQDEPTDSGFFTGTGIDSEVEAELEQLQPTGPVYPWRHAVALQQKRKMRSTELHYIDHPMLGVVVKVSPLDEEALRERAAAEFSSLQPEADASNR